METLIRAGELAVLRLGTHEIAPLMEVFEKVAGEQRWSLGEDIGAYLPYSVFFALERSSRIVGGLKLVVGNDEALPVTDAWPEIDILGRKDVADIALLAFDKEHRVEPRALWMVCTELWRYCEHNRISELWAELPPRNLRLFQRLGWPFRIKGEMRMHWGESCLPCMMTVRDGLSEATVRASNSAFFRSVVRQGLRQEGTN